MASIIKYIESFPEKMYRDLPYGTIYYVAGTDTPALNSYIKENADSIAEQLNSDLESWISCKIVYLASGNPFFPTHENATLYSAILPVDGINEAENPFLVASLDIQDSDLAFKAFLLFYYALQNQIDSALDYGKYDSADLCTICLRKDNDDYSSVASFPSDLAGVEFAIGSSYTADETSSRVMFSITETEEKHYDKPSRLVITPLQYKFLLPDYDNTEIHFPPQIKALYVLFLNHPEGIRMKEIEDYKEEYKQLYFRMTNRSDMDKLRLSVEKLIDVCNSNIICVKKSQCNTLIRWSLPDNELSRFYEIESNYGLPHKINLDRSLVTIPDELRL